MVHRPLQEYCSAQKLEMIADMGLLYVTFEHVFVLSECEKQSLSMYFISYKRYEAIEAMSTLRTFVDARY